MTTSRFTLDDWHAAADGWTPSRYGLASDYGLLAFALLNETELEPQLVEVLGASPALGEVTIRVDCGSPVHDLAAVQLLRECWLPELFPICSITHIEPARILSAALEHVLATR